VARNELRAIVGGQVAYDQTETNGNGPCCCSNGITSCR
jgi:hypothetical protein